MGNTFLNAHEMCAQEAAAIAMSMPLRHASRSFAHVPTCANRTSFLKSEEVLEMLEDCDSNIFCKGIIEHYVESKARSENLEVKAASLAEYACLWEPIGVSRKKYRRLPTPKILRYKFTPITEDEERHYREQILLFLPWEKEPVLPEQFHVYPREVDSAQNPTAHGSIKSWKDIYKKYEQKISMVKSIFISATQFDWDAIELEAAQAIQDRIHDQSVAESLNPCRSYAVNDPGNLQPDLRTNGNTKKAKQNQKKFEYTLAPQLIPDNEYRALVRSLNEEQRAIFNHCLYGVKLNEAPLRIFVTGGAGVGKSMVLKAVTQAMLRWFRSTNHADGSVDDASAPTVMVMAATGKAAWNVKGDTIHGALKFGYGAKKGQLPATSGDTRIALQKDFRLVKVS